MGRVVTNARYKPEVFDARTFDEARSVILTEEDDGKANERWHKETPYLGDLIEKSCQIGATSTVLDYGCGIGRLARMLIARYDCRVIGVDISPNMRALAAEYVASDRFVACAPEFLDAFAVKADLVLAVWVLQHCVEPVNDIQMIVSASKPGATLFLANERYRCVPVHDYGWVDDKKDVFGHGNNGPALCVSEYDLANWDCCRRAYSSDHRAAERSYNVE